MSDKNKMSFTFNDIIFSVEDGNVVPDTTTDAGPDTIELHEDAQKHGDNAEYDASEHVDVPEDVEKANESSFLGVILRKRSVETFAKTKGAFPNAEAFFKSNECKSAIATAKTWAEKHKVSLASSSDFPEKAGKMGFNSKTVNGALLGYRVLKGRLIVDIYFKNSKGRVSSKKLATVKIGEGKNQASADSAKPTSSKKPMSPIDKFLYGEESDNPVDGAFEPEAAEETPPPAAPTEPAAPEAPPADPAVETPAPSEEITPEEIDDETGTESFLGAVTNILRSREEADAAISEINDAEIDEVVGDGEGEDIEALPEPSVPAETPPPAEPEDEESKAIEAYLASIDF